MRTRVIPPHFRETNRWRTARIRPVVLRSARSDSVRRWTPGCQMTIFVGPLAPPPQSTCCLPPTPGSQVALHAEPARELLAFGDRLPDRLRRGSHFKLLFVRTAFLGAHGLGSSIGSDGPPPPPPRRPSCDRRVRTQHEPEQPPLRCPLVVIPHRQLGHLLRQLASECVAVARAGKPHLGFQRKRRQPLAARDRRGPAKCPGRARLSPPPRPDTPTKTGPQASRVGLNGPP